MLGARALKKKKKKKNTRRGRTTEEGGEKERVTTVERVIIKVTIRIISKAVEGGVKIGRK